MVSASLHADKQDNTISMVWYDPFRNSGSYFHQFPEGDHEWSEILDGKVFFEFDKHVDIVCSNPPYSCLNQVLVKSVELKPLIISFLVGMHNLTTKRIEFMNSHGYYMEKLHMCKIHNWYGMSFIIQFRLGVGENCMSYNRVYWK